MAILDVLVFPDPALRAETEEVVKFDGQLKKLITDMQETMIASKGVGLAAPQVGVPKKIIVIEWENESFVLINPKIIEQSGSDIRDEGCLSFPGIFENVERPTKVKVVYKDVEGKVCEHEAEDFLARIFAHEIDHLEKKLLIDHLSSLKKTFLRKKMERRAKQRKS